MSLTVTAVTCTPPRFLNCHLFTVIDDSLRLQYSNIKSNKEYFVLCRQIKESFASLKNEFNDPLGIKINILGQKEHIYN